MKFLLLSGIFILSSLGIKGQSFDLINSPYNEENPVISPDGQVLYFTRSNHPQNVGGSEDRGDIWYSKKLASGSWAPPIHAGAVLNSRGWNGVLGFNGEGSVMYLHHHYTDWGRPRTQGIAYSKKVGNEWSKPINLSIPYFKNMAENQGGWISGDENIILLSFEGFRSRGAEDIYVILRNADGTYREPVNLGESINTPYQEFTPYYNTEDSLLYFSSNGRGGLGSSDVFFSKRLDNTWRSWSLPVALGDSINTNGKELGFADYPEGKFSVFSSTQNSDGYGDIKIHRYGIAPAGEAKQRLFVINERTGEFMQANVLLLDQSSEESSLDVSIAGGDLSFFAPGEYRLTIFAPGFLTAQEKVSIGEGAESYTFALKPLEKGTRVVLENVLFEQSRDKLLPESYEQLNQVVRLMKENPDLKIRLEGHTDTRGLQSANLKLSTMRVEAVKDYLVSQGISKRRIQGKGFGGQQPLYPEDTEESRMKNRRVEFVIID